MTGTDTVALRNGCELRARWLAFSAIVLPTLSMFGPKALVGAVPVVAFVAVALYLWETGMLPRPSMRLAALLAAIFVWCAASVLWSVAPDRTMGRLPGLAAIFTVLFLLLNVFTLADPRLRWRIGVALAIGIVIAGAIAFIDLKLGAPLIVLFQTPTESGDEPLYSLYNRGIAVLAVLSWPAAMALLAAGRRSLGAALLFVMLALVWTFHGTSMAIAFTVGAVAALLVACAGRGGVILCGLVSTGLVLSAPFVANVVLERSQVVSFISESPNRSIFHRAEIWRFSAERILERPVVGYGFEASRAVPGASDRVLLPIRPEAEVPVKYAARLPLHSHNAALQLWLELGMIGAILGAVLLLFMWRWIEAVRSRLIRALAAGQLVTGLGIAGLSYGIWQAWWIASLALGAAFTLALTEQREVPGAVGVRGRPPSTGD